MSRSEYVDPRVALLKAQTTLDNEGWELVAAVPRGENGGMVEYMFKRPRQP